MAEPTQIDSGTRSGDTVGDVGARRAGTEAERHAARVLQRRLEQLGREVAVEPLRVRPATGLVHTIHTALGIVGSVLSVYRPALGLALVLLAVVSAFGDVTGAFEIVRRLTPSRASQNVVSDQETDRPGLVILTVAYDSPRTSVLTRSHRIAELWGRALIGSLALIAVCALVRLVGISAAPLTVIQFIATVVLIVLTPAFIDHALADADEDAATAPLETALRLVQMRLEHFDLMLLFTGASADASLGMRAWLKRHRRELETEATAVIELADLEVEHGYTTRE